MNAEGGTLHCVFGGATFDYGAQQQIVIILLNAVRRKPPVKNPQNYNWQTTSHDDLMQIPFIHREGL